MNGPANLTSFLLLSLHDIMKAIHTDPEGSQALQELLQYLYALQFPFE